MYHKGTKQLLTKESEVTIPGTKAGGKHAAETNKKRYGEEFYSRIGKIGGHNGHTGGFYANPELARIAGAKGGRSSKRGPVKKKTTIKKEDK